MNNNKSDACVLLSFSKVKFYNFEKSIALTDSIFKKYVSESRNITSNENYLFNPTHYKMFGDSDLMSLSFIDNFELCSRYFTKYQIELKSDDVNSSENFEPLEYDRYHQNLNYIIGDAIASDIFSSIRNIEDELHIIGLVNVKLDELKLIKYGRKLISNLANFINENLSSEIVICHSFGSFSWNDLTIIIKANSFERISETIVSLNNLCHKSDFSIHIDSKCESPLVIKTESSFGYRANLDTQKILDHSDSNDQIGVLVSAKEIRRTTKRSIDSLIKNSSLYYSFGDNDYHIKFGQIQKELYSTKEIISKILSLKSDIRTNKISISLYTCFFDKKSYSQKIETLEGDFTLFSKFVITQDELATFLKQLEILKISSSLKNSLIESLQKYNRYVSDPMYLSSFIELYPSIANIFKNVNEWCKGDILESLNNEKFEIEKVIYLFSKDFTYALLDRLQSTKGSNDIADNSLIFNGSFQKLFSSIHGYVSQISGFIGIKDIFAYMHVEPDISLSEFGLRINKLMLFRPEMLFIVIVAELFNHYPRKFTSNDTEYKKLFYSTNQNVRYHHLNLFKELIGKANNTFQSMKIFKTLLMNVDETFFDHIFIDYANFKYTFNFDYKLYTKWYWAFFQMCAGTKNLNGEIDPKHFLKFAIRAEFLRQICNETKVSVVDNFESSEAKDLFNSWDDWLTSFVKVFIQNIKSIQNFKENCENELTQLEESSSQNDSYHRFKKLCFEISNILNEIDSKYKFGEDYSYNREKGIYAKNVKFQKYIFNCRLKILLNGIDLSWQEKVKYIEMKNKPII